MRPVLIQIGDFEFYSFGLMAALALIVPGLSIVRALLRRRGAAADFAYELIVAAGVGGFLGARVYYLLEHLEAVRADFLADVLHVKPAKVEGKRPGTYTESQFATICRQLQSHVSAMAELYDSAVAA